MFIPHEMMDVDLLVSKNELGKGKSASFDGTDEEWMKILMDALFTQEDDTVQLGAKRKDKITVYQILGGIKFDVL
jgi:hypothetical protein